MDIEKFIFTMDICLQLATFSAIIWKLFSLTHELRTGQTRNRENINILISRLDNLEKAILTANAHILNSSIDRNNNN